MPIVSHNFTQVKWRIFCDICRVNSIDDHLGHIRKFDSDAEAINIANRCGWLKPDGSIVCDECNKKPLPQNNESSGFGAPGELAGLAGDKHQTGGEVKPCKLFETDKCEWHDGNPNDCAIDCKKRC